MPTVYNLAGLKETSDEALVNYLDSLGFKQSHAQSNVHLGLGYTSLAIAGVCYYWDFKLGFDATKLYSVAAVFVYALLNLAMTYFDKVHGTTVYVGTAPNGETIHIKTSSPKLTPTYEVDVAVAAKDGKTAAVSIARPYAEWFNSAGDFVALPFQTMFAANVVVIGAADSKRAAVAAKAANEADAADAVDAADSPSALPQYSTAVLDMLAAASSPAESSGADSDTAKATGASSGKKGGKRRKN